MTTDYGVPKWLRWVSGLTVLLGGIALSMCGIRP